MTDDGPDRFAVRLAEAARRIEEHLDTLMQRSAEDGTPPRLIAAMRHGLLAGGKRFRPFLVLEMAALHGGTAVDAGLDVAAALECVHAYSLVHDDLPAMDNDETRRGRPTVWKAFDEWTATLAGDALLTLAFEVLARPLARTAPASSLAIAPAIRLELTGLLARAAGQAGMVGGQMLDLEAEKLSLPARPDAAHVSRLQAMKTGALITFACEAGARAAGAPAADVAAARTYGANLGLAFQISDDLLDVAGDAATVGKAVGKDLALGKATLVGVLGEHAARLELDAAVRRAEAALEPYGARAAVLRAAARFQTHRRH